MPDHASTRQAARDAGDPPPPLCWHRLRGGAQPGCYGCAETDRWRRRWPL